MQAIGISILTNTKFHPKFTQTKFGFLLELILIHFYSGGFNDFSSVTHVNAYIVVSTFERWILKILNN